MIAGGTKITKDQASRFMWIAGLVGKKTCGDLLPIAKRGDTACPTDMDTYLRTLSCKKLSDTFKMSLAQAIKSKPSTAYGFGFRDTRRITASSVCRLFDQAIRFRKTIDVGTISVSGATTAPAVPPTAPVRASSRPVVHAGLERVEMTDRQRQLLGEAFLKVARKLYGRFVDVGAAAKMLRDTNFHWESSGDQKRIVIVSEFKDRFTREISRIVRRNRKTFKGMFPRGRITSKHAAKVYNALVYPPTASTEPTPVTPTQPSTPPAPTVSPSGVGAAPQGSGATGGAMTQAIKAKIHQGWDDKCAGHGRTETLAELSGAAKQEAERICNMTTESQRDAYFRQTPWNRLPGWLRLSIQNNRVAGAQYAQVFGSGGATPPSASSSPPSASSSPPSGSTDPVVMRGGVPPPKKGKPRPVHGGVVKVRHTVDAGFQGSVGVQNSGSTEPYPGENGAKLNQSRGYEVGFFGKAMFKVAQRWKVGVAVDYSAGWHKVSKSLSGDTIKHGDFRQWSLRAALEYGMPYGFFFGASLGGGSTELDKAYFGEGGDNLTRKTIDFVLSLDAGGRWALWSSGSIDVGIMAQVSVKSVYGLDKGVGRDWQAENTVINTPVYTRNMGVKATGTVCIYAGF